ncbi:hypothetical protein CBR_g16129 [Chara braunii]|uniref:Integrase catalytic domain-containing protein n=1 Tax=Chara braunii TaxID=69332 RepID=A0A388KU00_CHABU|nr:hypothetical protein CBR_g16129 [Chara braunii]|eukprot:GBG73413.1 hypothetical protein CBR_g16129 [Chara braunii]
MCGYYRNFVKNYSTIASPLTDLTRLDTPWEWSDECEATFKRLKHALMNHEVRMVPDPQKPFIVTTDTSQYSIGAVLAQQDGKMRPIKYMSKKMPSKKLAKSTYERELYALYKALVYWRHFLLGRFFYLRTDHQTLKWIKTQPTLSDALKRWIEVIDQYDFKLEYLKGEYNKVADALARRADYLRALVSKFGVSEEVTQSLMGAYQEDPVTMDIIRKLQGKDKATEDEFVIVNGLLFLEKDGFKRSGKRHIFVVVDRFTKYVRLIAMSKTARTEHVIKLFMDNWLCDFGLPKTIVSDRDVRFTSEFWKKTAEQMGNQLQMASGNHHKANGLTEQMNRVVKHPLRHYIKPSQDDWDEKLPLIASLYNNAVHSTTGVSPNQLHFGWKPRSALDFLLPENRPVATLGTMEYGVQYEKLLQQVVEHIKKSQEVMIASENKHRRQSTFQVLEKPREANFKINAKKCKWAKTQVLYLGHILDGDGIKQEDSKIAMIRDWPTTRTLAELRSFLGLTNYYRKFVRNFSNIAAPLRQLLKKATIWQWDKDCTSVLKKFKRTLIEYPVLKVADPSLPFVVTTNVSQHGIGVVLQQDGDNGYRPVEFMSTRMPSKKVSTSTYERELYALRQASEH